MLDVRVQHEIIKILATNLTGEVGRSAKVPFRHVCVHHHVELQIFTTGLSPEGDSCEFGSQKYLILCGFGGILSCGTTHTAVVPLDLVKCRMQVCPLPLGVR